MSGPVATDDAAPVPGAPGPGRRPGRRDRPGAPHPGGFVAGPPGPAATPAPHRGVLVLRRSCRPRPGRTGRGVRHRTASPHGPADRDMARGRRAPASRQPGFRAAHPARPAEPHDRGPRGVPRRGGSGTGRRGARGPALGGPAGRHPRRSGRPSSIMPSCRASSSTTPRGPCSWVTWPGSPRRRGATPSTWEQSSGCAGRARWCRSAPTTNTPWSSSRAGSRWTVSVVEPGVLAYLGLGPGRVPVRGGDAGAGPPARRRAVSRGRPHVVELRRAQPRGGLRGQAAMDGRRRPLRARAVLAQPDRGGRAALGVINRPP